MPISCDPDVLAAESSCFCYDKKIEPAIIIYLLSQIAGSTKTPAELAKAAKCYTGLDKKMEQAVIVYLLCTIVNK